MVALERRVNATSVEPLCPALAEDLFPVDIARLELACCGVAAVGAAHRTANTEAALGEVQFASDAVVVHPLDELGVDAALENEVLDQAVRLGCRQRGDDGGFEAKTAAGMSDVVFRLRLPVL